MKRTFSESGLPPSHPGTPSASASGHDDAEARHEAGHEDCIKHENLLRANVALLKKKIKSHEKFERLLLNNIALLKSTNGINLPVISIQKRTARIREKDGVKVLDIVDKVDGGAEAVVGAPDAVFSGSKMVITFDDEHQHIAKRFVEAANIFEEHSDKAALEDVQKLINSSIEELVQKFCERAKVMTAEEEEEEVDV
jgi:hypothetical protein